jgi:3-hydroxybutyryl-CoA dehydrogenase
MHIKKVGVVGCGLMGHGITQVAAQSGYDVVVREVSQEKLDSGLGQIRKQLGRAVERQKMEQSQADEVIGRINATLSYEDFAECDLVVEAITEDLDAKLAMWRELDPIVKEEALFATNTSSLGVVNQAAVTERPEHFLGLHFFNPAQVMPLLEVVQSITTSTAALETGFEWGKSLNKTVVHARDKTGFIVNRLLIPFLLDAIRAWEEGFGSIEQIDTAMKGGANHPMGPFQLLDFVGLDTSHSVGEIMFEEYRERRFAPPPTLRKIETHPTAQISKLGFTFYSSSKKLWSNFFNIKYSLSVTPIPYSIISSASRSPSISTIAAVASSGCGATWSPSMSVAAKKSGVRSTPGRMRTCASGRTSSRSTRRRKEKISASARGRLISGRSAGPQCGDGSRTTPSSI